MRWPTCSAARVARADAAPSLSPWLAEYLQRRIHVTGWLLDHWRDPPPAHDSVVDAAQVEETLALAGAHLHGGTA